MLNKPMTKEEIRHVEHYTFKMEDKVLIKELQLRGVIEALMTDKSEQNYRVTFWCNSDRKSMWLPAHELELKS